MNNRSDITSDDSTRVISEPLKALEIPADIHTRVAFSNCLLFLVLLSRVIGLECYSNVTEETGVISVRERGREREKEGEIPIRFASLLIAISQ